MVTGEFRLGDVRHIIASSNLARERLGGAADVVLADGLKGLSAR